MPSTTAALKALASHVLPRLKDPSQGIGIHLENRWTGESSLALGGADVPLIFCESNLAARDAMVAQARAERPWLLLTPLSERELGDDVISRLFDCRLLRLDRWRILRDRLGAHRIDPRLSRLPWLADALLMVLPPGSAKTASGFLAAETAWGILLEGFFGLRPARPDLRALLAWSESAEASAWGASDEATARPIERRVSPELLQAASAWIQESAGEAGERILELAREGHARDALPLGVVMDLIFAGEGDETDLRVAAARLERYVGNRPIPRETGLAWGRATAAVVRRKLEGERAEALATLQRAETIARAIDLREASVHSRLLPSGVAGRWKSLATALERDNTAFLDAALAGLEQHVLLRDDDAQTAEMLVRLKRWLLAGPGEVPASVPGFGRWMLEDGGWVDRLRGGLRGRSLPGDVEHAAKALLDEADRRREDLNRGFGQQLAGWLSSGAQASGATLESERMIAEVLAPLAMAGPVLLVLLDGLSHAVLLELLQDVRHQGWRELTPVETSERRLLIAPLPTKTDVTRCSLLAGRLLRGADHVERKAFRQHPKLVAASKPSRPPRLFHKGTLEDDGLLSSELREMLLERAQRVVGVVVNAIDDQLSGSDQISLRWTETIIRPLQSLLAVAGQAGRLVLIAGDHGHVLESGSMFAKHGKKGGDGTRWRRLAGDSTDPELAEGEVLLEGSRVLEGDGRIVAPWSEELRYGSKSAGYHGGASPQEVLVPFTVLCAGEAPDGWLEIEPEPPLWWTGETITPATAQEVSSVPSKAEDDPQLGLFSPAPEPADATGAPAWLDQLLASELLAQQRQVSGRAALDEDLMRALLIALEERGGRATHPTLARAISYPAGRLRGFLALVQKVLNVEGFPVLEIDEASATVSFNRELLIAQFELIS